MDKRPDYEIPAELTAAKTAAGLTWLFQIGPGVQGQGQGVIYPTQAMLYLLLGAGNPGATYVTYSTNGGASWISLPNNQPTPVQGSNSIQYRFSCPPGADWKLAFGLNI
jgi:hypothetical protein